MRRSTSQRPSPPLSLPRPAAAQQTLNVVTAGDQNMVDYVNDYLGPKFEKMHPGVKVRAVGTGPGDAGSQKIYEKLDAQQKAGAATWDVDVAVIHQKAAGTMVKEKLLDDVPRRHRRPASSSSRDTAKNALGAERRRLRACRCSTARRDRLQPRPREGRRRTTYRRARRMGEEEPEAVRLQRHQGRHVRRRLRHRAGSTRTAATATSSRRAPTTPADEGGDGTRRSASLKEFNQNVVMTPGNAGTLDMLNRGEIAMGPVWVDMFYTWKADGKLPPNMKLKLVAPGMPGQPMYYVDAGEGGERASWPRSSSRSPTSPEVQADGIVKQFNWYPGIDAQVRRRQARPGGLEQALHRHLAGRPRRRRASPSRSRPTSTTSSKATRRKVAN